MYANAFLFSIEPVRCLCFLIHNKMWVILARSQIPWDFFYQFIVAEECWLKVAVCSCVSAVFPFMDLRVCYEEFGLLSTLLYTFISMPLVVLFWAEQILSLIRVVWVGRKALGEFCCMDLKFWTSCMTWCQYFSHVPKYIFHYFCRNQLVCITMPRNILY